MALHEPFGHFQPKLWAKEGPRVKLAIWLPTTQSQESTRSGRWQKECGMMLKSSWRELQDFFRPHPNQRSEQEVMDAQSPGSSTRDNFGTPPWESREKVPFGCSSRGELQRILYGGRWWFPPSPGHGESNESFFLSFNLTLIPRLEKSGLERSIWRLLPSWFKQNTPIV
jgi:hypothetical protein